MLRRKDELVYIKKLTEIVNDEVLAEHMLSIFQVAMIQIMAENRELPIPNIGILKLSHVGIKWSKDPVFPIFRVQPFRRMEGTIHDIVRKSMKKEELEVPENMTWNNVHNIVNMAAYGVKGLKETDKAKYVLITSFIDKVCERFNLEDIDNFDESLDNLEDILEIIETMGVDERNKYNLLSILYPRSTYRHLYEKESDD